MLERTPNFFTARHHAMHVPRTMFAAAIGRFGGPEVITPHALPVPAVDAGEVLIAVDTAGVGRWDADIREGYFAARKPHFPMVLGFDGAGIVAAVGSRVRRLRVGDEVYSYNWQNPKGGFYAEYVAVPADKAAPIPKRVCEASWCGGCSQLHRARKACNWCRRWARKWPSTASASMSTIRRAALRPMASRPCWLSPVETRWRNV
jgi:hypothetical protein